LESDMELDKILKNVFSEHQIYRIDHYLGKETIQNILLFQFANSIDDDMEVSWSLITPILKAWEKEQQSVISRYC